MKRQSTIIAIFALFILALGANVANAQFGDLINRAQKKIDKTTEKINTGTNVNTNGGGCGTVRPSGPPIGNQPLTERTPGCPNFIGLSKSPIDPNNLKAAQFTTQFRAGDPIYGIIFTDGALKNWARPNASNDKVKELTLNLEGGTNKPDENTNYFGSDITASATITVTSEMLNQNYATFAFIPKPSAAMNADEITNGYNFIESLKRNNNSDKYYASVQVIGWSPAPRLAPVVIDLSSGIQPYLAMKGQIDNARSKNLNADAKDAVLPVAAMKNPALEKQIAALMQKEFKVELLKIIITWDDWQPVYHNVTGALIARTLETRNLVKEEGNCKVKSLQIFQDKTGAGYGKMYINGMGRTDDYIVPCEKVK